MPESKSHNRKLTATQKQAEALRLRTGGMEWAQIAERVGYRGPSGAYKAVDSALKKTLREPADELRTLEAERLDRMLEAIWADATKGNEWKIDRVLSIMERRAKLLGLDQPPERDLGDEAQKYLDLMEIVRTDAKDMSE